MMALLQSGLLGKSSGIEGLLGGSNTSLCRDGLKVGLRDIVDQLFLRTQDCRQRSIGVVLGLFDFAFTSAEIE